MDGLLAWAADVVGAGSDPESPAAPAPALRFSLEQLEEIRKLDGRAAELQQDLQQLRQKIPPPDIAQRLPHLHAESLASQSALALELHAHSASRIQAEIRESSLQSDIAAYKKALVATEQQALERAREAQELEKSLQELDQLEKTLREEYDSLVNAAPDHDSYQELELESPPSEEEVEELQTLKAELAKWQTRVQESRTELSMVQNEASTRLSSAQREKDLERRLRTLSEQLAAKQAQAEKLIIERDALGLRVEHAIEGHRSWSATAEGHAHTVKRNKIGLKRTLNETDQRRTRGMAHRNVPGVKSISFRRAVLVAYLFTLHVVVLVILSNSRS